jgi:hypothetical protein
MTELAQQFVAYLGQFETWPWWEKALWVLPGLAFLRLMWWLFERLTDEAKSAGARTVAGFGLLACVIIVVGALAFLASSIS